MGKVQADILLTLGVDERSYNEIDENIRKNLEEMVKEVTNAEKAITTNYSKMFANVIQQLLNSMKGAGDKLGEVAEEVVGKYRYLQQINKDFGVGGKAFEFFNTKDLENVLKNYDKIIAKKKEIAELDTAASKESYKKTKIQETMMSIGDIKEKYKLKDGTAEIKKELKELKGYEKSKMSDDAMNEYASLVDMYKQINKIQTTIGTDKDIIKKQALYTLGNEINGIVNEFGFLKKYTKDNEIELSVEKMAKNIDNSVSQLIKNNIQQENNRLQALEKSAKQTALRIYEARKKGFSGEFKDYDIDLENVTGLLEKFAVDIETAKEKISELNTATHNRPFKGMEEEYQDLIGYVQRYIDLGGDLNDLNLSGTATKLFNDDKEATLKQIKEQVQQFKNIKNIVFGAVGGGTGDGTGEGGGLGSGTGGNGTGNGTEWTENGTGSIGGLTEEQLQGLINKLEEIKKAIDEVKKSVDGIGNDESLKNISNTFDEINTSFTSLRTSLEDGGMFTTAVNGFSDAIEKVSTALEKIDNSNQQIENLKGRIEELSSALDELKNKENQINTTEVIPNSMQKTTEQISEQTNQSTDELQKIQQQAEETTSAIQKLNNQQNEIKKQSTEIVDTKNIENAQQVLNKLISIKRVIDDLTSDDNYDLLGLQTLDDSDFKQVIKELKNINIDDLNGFGIKTDNVKKVFSNFLTEIDKGKRINTKYKKGQIDTNEYENIHGQPIDSLVSDPINNFSIALNKIVPVLQNKIKSASDNAIQKVYNLLDEFDKWNDKNVEKSSVFHPNVYANTKEEVENGIKKLNEYNNKFEDISKSDVFNKLSSTKQSEILKYISYIEQLIDSSERILDIQKQFDEQNRSQISNVASSPTQTFDNEIQQNLVMLENYKNTIAEIDKLKLEPETDETKQKIEELNKLADYFASRITDIRSENNSHVSPEMMEFGGVLNQSIMKNYNPDQIKELRKIAHERYGVQANLPIPEFNYISEELNKIEQASEGLRNALTKDLTESRQYVSRVKADLTNLVETYEELQYTKEGTKDYELYQKDIDVFSKRSPEVLQFLDKIKTYDQAIEFVKTEEWLGFLATLPKAHTYLESIGYDFERIKNISNQSPTQNQPVIENIQEEIQEQLSEQSSPTLINVKPNIDPQEFVDEITNNIKDEFAKVNVEPLPVGEFDAEGFVTKVNKNLESSYVQVNVEPSSDINSDEFAQKVTTLLSGQNVNVDINPTYSPATVSSGDVKESLINLDEEKNRLDSLKDTIDDVKRSIGQKTSAFINEQGQVDKTVNIEKQKLSDLKDSVSLVTTAIEGKTSAFEQEVNIVKDAVIKEHDYLKTLVEDLDAIKEKAKIELEIKNTVKQKEENDVKNKIIKENEKVAKKQKDEQDKTRKDEINKLLQDQKQAYIEQLNLEKQILQTNPSKDGNLYSKQNSQLQEQKKIVEEKGKLLKQLDEEYDHEKRIGELQEENKKTLNEIDRIRANIVDKSKKEVETKKDKEIEMTKLQLKAEEDNRKFDEQRKKEIVGNSLNAFQRQIDSADKATRKTEEYENKLNEIKDKYEELNRYKDFTIFTEDDQNDINNINKELNKMFEELSNIDKAGNAAKASSIAAQISSYLERNTKLNNTAQGREYVAQLKELQATLKKVGLTDTDIQGVVETFNNLKISINEANLAGKSFFDAIKDKVFYKAAEYIARYFSFEDWIRFAKQAFQTIRQLDTALVDLRKTTTMSSSELDKFYKSSNNVAKQMGVTTEEIINQASAWSRLGYSSADAATKMAEISSKFASISPGMTTEQAQSGLVSIMKAWDIDVNQAEREILDNINILGNRFAETNLDIVEGMQRSAAALSAVGTSYKDAFALFTGGQEIVQNSEVMGRALRSISLRIRGFSEDSSDDLMEVDEELKNISGDLVDLTKTAQHSEGVSIFKPGSTTEYKSLVEYLGDISEIWDEMTEVQQNAFLNKAFAKTQAQAGAALIKNYDAIKKALEEMESAAGSADREMNIIRDKKYCPYVQKCA